MAKATVRTRSAPAVPAVSAAARPAIHQVALWGLAALLFFPPFFRGLFFPLEQYRALAGAAVLFWMVFYGRWVNREQRIFEHPLDYLMLAFPAVYLYSAFFAVNTGLAVNEVVKATLYFLAFWTAARLVRGEEDANFLVTVIYLSALGVALAGLATATGIIHIKDGFLNGRIYSSYQYPNALAALLMGVYILGTYLWQRATAAGGRLNLPFDFVPRWLKETDAYPYLYALGNYLLLAVFFGTRSRGGIVVFIPVLILFLIGAGKNWRIPSAWHLALTGGPAALAIWLFLNDVAGNHADRAWLWIFLGALAVLLGQALVDAWHRKDLTARIAPRRTYVVAGAAAAVAGIAALVVALQPALVQTLVRFKSLGELLTAHSTVERFHWIGQAAKMMLARPLTGWGGGGWQEAYRHYQDYLYNSTQVHGHYLQVGVETGIIGLLVLVAIWAVFLWTAHRLYYGSAPGSPRRLLVWGITMGAVAIGAHAAVDFDLSLSALALVLFALFGIAVGLACPAPDVVEIRRRRRAQKSYAPPSGGRLGAVSVACAVVLAFAVSLALAGNFAGRAAAALNTGDYTQGVTLMERARAYNPFSPDYPAALAQAYRARGDFDRALQAALDARARSQYDAARCADLANVSYGAGKYAEAEKWAEKAVSLAPFQVRWYELLARTEFMNGYAELANNNSDAARAYFEKAVQVPRRIEAQMAKVTPELKKLWVGAPLMTATPDVKLSAGAAQYFLGEFDQAARSLAAAQKETKDNATRGEAMVWLALVKEKQGQAAEAKKLLEEAEKLNKDFAAAYEQLKALPVLQ
ncbi:MAG: O-antigen ligase family protein [Desulfotomaculales bacterium]